MHLLIAKLLKDYKNNVIDWRSFSMKFRYQLRSSLSSKQAIDQIIELSGNQDVTLLCYEREGQKCHRNIVKIDY
ncbi:MAG: DUF488 domain-containing protein [Candidatus Bathyarchaeia archaeon]